MKRILMLGATLTLAPLTFAEHSPWLAEPGNLAFSLSQVHQTADEFYRQTEKTQLPDDLQQDTTWLSVDYVFSDDIAFDLRAGYAKSTFNPENPQHKSGLTDTNIGISWRIVDEFISDYSLPSIVFRAGAIIKGDYDVGTIHAIGDGANGIEGSLVIGKIFNQYFAVSAEAGYRKRDSDVPDDAFYKLAGYFTPINGLTTSIRYAYVDGQDGLDIGGPGFDGTNFQLLEEDSQLINIGASYTFSNQLNVGIDLGTVIDGRNTSKSDIAALTLGYAL